MKEIVIISGKGGTGKTSITGSLCALAGNAVIADCDVDAPDLYLLLQPAVIEKHDFLGGKKAAIDHTKCNECSVCQDLCRFDAITDFHVDPFQCEGCGVCVWNCPQDAIEFKHAKNGEWYISDTRFGKMVHAQLHPGEENSGKLVTEVKNQARNIADQQNADLILVDGPPGTGCAVIAAIGGADKVLLITEPSLSALHDLQRAVKLAQHFGISCSVCINKFDVNTSVVEKIELFCKENKINIIGKISFDKAITEAQLQGQSIIEFSENQTTNEIKMMYNNLLKD